MFRTSVTALALTFAASAGQAAIIDFESFSRGAEISGSTFFIDGVSVDVTANANAGGLDKAIAFDTNDAGTTADGDPDLASDFTRDPNTGDQSAPALLNPGMVLVIAEDPVSDNGADTNPDDNAKGGFVTFTFGKPVTFGGFDVFDDVKDFSVTSDQGDVLTGIDVAKDNWYARISDLAWTNVTTLTFDFGDASGAIDNIQIAPVPVPASMSLLLAGVAGLGFAARRRKTA